MGLIKEAQYHIEINSCGVSKTPYIDFILSKNYVKK